MINETGRWTIDAGLHLLDRQIVDKESLMAGKVDDLEITFPGNGERPFISAILSGVEPLAASMGGRTGRVVSALASRLANEPTETRISLGAVKRLDNHVELAVSRRDLDPGRQEQWARETVISKIPGAEHSP